jgi:hypothetical protein
MQHQDILSIVDGSSLEDSLYKLEILLYSYFSLKYGQDVRGSVNYRKPGDADINMFFKQQ